MRSGVGVKMWGIFPYLFLLILVSGCIFFQDPGVVKSVWGNSFMNDSQHCAYAFSEPAITLENFSGDCYREKKEGEEFQTFQREPGIGWKFITFKVHLHNEMNASMLEFNPIYIIDTDNLIYGNDNIYNSIYNSKLKVCDYGYEFFDRSYDLERKVGPNEYKEFTLVYKIPLSSVPDRFYYYISTEDHSWISGTGELSLRLKRWWQFWK
jgi:hypothetical protein